VIELSSNKQLQRTCVELRAQPAAEPWLWTGVVPAAVPPIAFSRAPDPR
jgi:hypothetical protein